MSKIAKAKFTVILNLSNFKMCQRIEIETKFSLAPRQPTQLKFNQFFCRTACGQDHDAKIKLSKNCGCLKFKTSQQIDKIIQINLKI